MNTLLRLFELITSDTLTMAASGVLALAVVALLVLIAWPARHDAPAGAARGPRAAEARALAASGTSMVEIARRTGLSRDALALMLASATTSARQKGPNTARLSLLQRIRQSFGGGAVRSQVPV